MSRQSLLGIVVFALISLMLVRIPPMVAMQDSVLNTYRSLVEVNALAKQRYVVPIHGDRLVNGAIRGMLLELDPYSGYIAPEALAAFYRRSHGEYVGIGIEVGLLDKRVTVIAPVDQGPAAKAGILSGDVILGIDGVSTHQRSVFDVNELLSGPHGSSVTLRVRRKGETAAVSIPITRGPVSLTTVRGFRRDEGNAWDYRIDPEHAIAYFRISSFHENTTGDLVKAIHSLNATDRRAILLDLRFNPGGLMESAVEMADCFIDSGLILSTVTRRKAVQEYRATSEGTLLDPTLVVLVNSGSASSSEIVAGSLQDRGRALVVGERSFGKGSVQRLFELATSKAAVKLTIAYYRLPSGRVIHRPRHPSADDDWGILPDVTVAISEEETRLIQRARGQLDNHAGEANPLDSAGDPAPAREIPRDRQLQAALDLALSELTRRNSGQAKQVANVIRPAPSAPTP